MGRRPFRPPRAARTKIQALRVSSPPPANLQQVAGFYFAEGGAVPDNMRQISSATYSLGSPAVSGAQRIAVFAFSLGSASIPAGLKRVAILPE